MITTYLLQNCKHCKDLLDYIKNNPNVNICLIMISKKDIPIMQYGDARMSQYPMAFTGSPTKLGLPKKGSSVMYGSKQILNAFKNNFGNLKGSSIKIDYKNNNISSLSEIRTKRNSCFGKSCHIMDRPYGPYDNQYLLQGYQPPCAIPKRSDLPIKKFKFGMTTPGTTQWQLERKIWSKPEILINSKNSEQDLNVNKNVKMNVPLTYSNDHINQKVWNPLNLNNFGNKQRTIPINQTAPFLTYAAGGNGISNITKQNYLRQQVPIKKSPNTGYISGNIKKYALNNYSNQELLANGLNSPWSINAQGIANKYGNNSIDNKLQLTRTVSGNGTNQAQYFKKNMFPNNGNGYGAKKNGPKKKSPKKKSAERSITKKSITKDSGPERSVTKRSVAKDSGPERSVTKRSVAKDSGPERSVTKRSITKDSGPERSVTKRSVAKKMKFTSPLGIEISFN